LHGIALPFFNGPISENFNPILSVPPAFEQEAMCENGRCIAHGSFEMSLTAENQISFDVTFFPGMIDEQAAIESCLARLGEKNKGEFMFCQLNSLAQKSSRYFLLAALLPVAAVAVGTDQPASSEALGKKLEPFAQPPEEFAGKFGPYRSPLKFADGSMVKSAADWTRRRDEISTTWHKRLGSWPALVERPVLKKLAKIEREGYTEYKVQVQVSISGNTVVGYLLVPNGTGPFPAVLVPFYEPLTSAAARPRFRRRAGPAQELASAQPSRRRQQLAREKESRLLDRTQGSHSHCRGPRTGTCVPRIPPEICGAGQAQKMIDSGESMEPLRSTLNQLAAAGFEPARGLPPRGF
jgi:hypothetical protein